MPLIPYRFFPGTCEEALNFDAEVFGGTVEGLMRFPEMPPGETGIAPALAERVANATFRAGDAVMMASDSADPGFTEARGTSLYMGFAETAAAAAAFERLAEGGSVGMPFAPTFWSPGFGTVRDRFGTDWMIGTDAPAA